MDAYSNQSLEEHLHRTLTKSAALRKRRAVTLRLVGATLALALGGSLSTFLLSTGGSVPGNPGNAPTVVVGQLIYSGLSRPRDVAQGRVTFTNPSGIEAATTVAGGSFRLYVPAGHYSVAGIARTPYKARCAGPSITISKKQTHATETIECHVHT